MCMKYKLLLLLLLLSFLSVDRIKGQETNQFVVTYADCVPNNYVRSNEHSPRKAPVRYIKSESLEVKSRLGHFVASCELNRYVTYGVLQCLKLAMNSWEQKLEIKTPVRFYFRISDSIDPSTAINTTVGYSRVTSTLSVPDNLYAQKISGVSINDTITVNSQIDWKSWPDDEFFNGSVSLVTYLTRNIARVLGFGSSLVKRNSYLGFSANRIPSAFDHLIYNGEQYLSDLNRASSSKLDLFFAKDIRLKSDAFEYDLYDTGRFLYGLSGSYFSLGYDNLLEHEISNKSEVLPINAETLNVLSKIGWNTTKNDRVIECNNTDKLGRGSVFDDFTFSLIDANRGNSLNANWQYQVYDLNKLCYETILTGKGKTFNVKPSVIEGSLDDDLCVQARVVANESGTEYYFPLTLETRPVISDVKISDVKKTDNNRYQFNLDIIQKGATGGYVLVDDYTGATHEYSYTGKTISVSGILVGMETYIYITLENEYNTSSRLIVGDFYNQEMKLVNENKAYSSTYKTLSKSLGGKILRDGDVLAMSIDDFEGQVDSVKWYLHEGGYYKHLATKYGNEKSFCFNVSKANLDFESRRYAVGDSAEVILGSTWKNDIVGPYGQYFYATIYCHDGEYMRVYEYTFTDFDFDLIPTRLKVDILNVQPVFEGEDEWIKADVKFDTENFSNVFLYVADSGFWNYRYLYDPHVTPDNINETVSLYFADWTEQFYCVACNDYGYYQSEIFSLARTSIDDVQDSTFKVNIENNGIEVRNNNLFDCSIYDIRGTLLESVNNVNDFSKGLSKGVYILKMYDKVSSKKVTRKIIIK